MDQQQQQLTPGPHDLRQLSAAATRLAGEVHDVLTRIRASTDEAVRGTGFRLDDVAGELRLAARELEQTSIELGRVDQVREDPRLCQTDWGVCPDHGDSLTSSGGISQCRVDARVWSYDRLAAPCGEPVTEQVTDPEGHVSRLCHGHALAVPSKTGWRVNSLPDNARGRDDDRHPPT